MKLSVLAKNRRFSVTLIICLVIIVYLIFIALRSGQPIFKTQNSQLLIGYGAVNGQLLSQGDYWRLCVSQFTHVNLYHLLINVVFLFILGLYIERNSGLLTVLFVYFFGGIVGQYASVFFNPSLVSSGASQAICSLAGFLVIRFFRVWRTSKVTGIAVLLCIIIQCYLDLHFAHRLKEGHIFGFVIGVMISLILYKRKNLLGRTR